MTYRPLELRMNTKMNAILINTALKTAHGYAPNRIFANWPEIESMMISFEKDIIQHFPK